MASRVASRIRAIMALSTSTSLASRIQVLTANIRLLASRVLGDDDVRVRQLLHRYQSSTERSRNLQSIVALGEIWASLSASLIDKRVVEIASKSGVLESKEDTKKNPFHRSFNSCLASYMKAVRQLEQVAGKLKESESLLEQRTAELKKVSDDRDNLRLNTDLLRAGLEAATEKEANMGLPNRHQRATTQLDGVSSSFGGTMFSGLRRGLFSGEVKSVGVQTSARGNYCEKCMLEEETGDSGGLQEVQELKQAEEAKRAELEEEVAALLNLRKHDELQIEKLEAELKKVKTAWSRMLEENVEDTPGCLGCMCKQCRAARKALIQLKHSEKQVEKLRNSLMESAHEYAAGTQSLQDSLTAKEAEVAQLTRQLTAMRGANAHELKNSIALASSADDDSSSDQQRSLVQRMRKELDAEQRRRKDAEKAGQMAELRATREAKRVQKLMELLGSRESGGVPGPRASTGRRGEAPPSHRALVAQVASLKKTVSGKDNTITLLNAQLKAKAGDSARLAALTKELETAHKRIADLEAQLRELMEWKTQFMLRTSAEKKHMQRALDEVIVQKDLAAKVRVMEALKKQKGDLESAHASHTKEQLSAQKGEMLSHFRKELGEHQGRWDEERTMLVEQLRSQESAFAAEVKEKEDELIIIKRESMQLKEKMDRSERDIVMKERRLNSLMKEAKRSTKDAYVAKEQVHQLKRSLETSKAKRALQEARTSQMMEVQKTEISTLRQQLVGVKEELAVALQTIQTGGAVGGPGGGAKGKKLKRRLRRFSEFVPPGGESKQAAEQGSLATSTAQSGLLTKQGVQSAAGVASATGARAAVGDGTGGRGPAGAGESHQQPEASTLQMDRIRQRNMRRVTRGRQKSIHGMGQAALAQLEAMGLRTTADGRLVLNNRMRTGQGSSSGVQSDGHGSTGSSEHTEDSDVPSQSRAVAQADGRGSQRPRPGARGGGEEQKESRSDAVWEHGSARASSQRGVRGAESSMKVLRGRMSSLTQQSQATARRRPASSEYTSPSAANMVSADSQLADWLQSETAQRESVQERAQRVAGSQAWASRVRQHRAAQQSMRASSQENGLTSPSSGGMQATGSQAVGGGSEVEDSSGSASSSMWGVQPSGMLSGRARRRRRESASSPFFGGLTSGSPGLHSDLDDFVSGFGDTGGGTGGRVNRRFDRLSSVGGGPSAVHGGDGDDLNEQDLWLHDQSFQTSQSAQSQDDPTSSVFDSAQSHGAYVSMEDMKAATFGQSPVSVRRRGNAVKSKVSYDGTRTNNLVDSLDLLLHRQ